MNKNFILNFTPTSMIPTREMTPHVPVTPEEIIQQILEVSNLGVNMVHLHARNLHNTKPAYEKEIYAEIISGIRKKNEKIIITLSTSGRDFAEFDKRSDCLDLDGDLKPDFASLTLSSLNFNKQASINSPQMIQDLARKMMDKGVKPELEVFDLGMINYAKYLIKQNLIKPPYYFTLILGNIACAQADLLSLGLMIRELPEGSIWSAGGIGNFQLKMNAMAIMAGGGVRIGLEDNICYYKERTRLATNYELVERIVDITNVMEIQPYTPKEARDVLGL